MTLIVLGAVILDRRALTMRNLAFAVLAVVALEPEAILGVSFQLSFAAVGALVAVMEARLARVDAGRRSVPAAARTRPPRRGAFSSISSTSRSALLVATALRDQRHRLVHGLSFPRPQPLCADRQSADADGHRVLRRAGRAARDGALSARPRRAGLALCRRRHQVHPVGRALHRRARPARRCTCAPSRPSRCRS